MFNSITTIKDLTVLHAWILLNIYSPEGYEMREIRPQAWIRTREELEATMDLVNLGLAGCHNGIFFRTWKGEQERERLYNRPKSLHYV